MAPVIVQRDICVSLHLSPAIPVGLAVPYNIQHHLCFLLPVKLILSIRISLKNVNATTEDALASGHPGQYNKTGSDRSGAAGSCL